jgi:phenylacetate-coenzyme A ligase PaaK-like adenylate-forming protein
MISMQRLHQQERKIKQERKLKALLRHCKAQTPFYEKLITDAAVSRPLEALADLPLVDKRVICGDYSQFVSRSVIAEPSDHDLVLHALSNQSNLENEAPLELACGETLFFEKTSGSTGNPLKMVKSMHERLSAGKSVWKLRRRLDAAVTPANMFPFEHAPLHFDFPYNTGDYSPDNVRKILDEISRRGYIWLHGHPQGLEWWAEIILDDPNIGKLARFNYIESNGSKLFDRSREIIQQAFACPVIDNYNCREVWTVAYECRNQRLHLNDELIIAELLDERGHPINEPGAAGRLFITSLYCFTMPFIRYNLGDQVQYSMPGCDCGEPSPVIEALPGRPSERVFGREELFGSDVFSKVTRFLYGAFDFQYTQVRVLQTQPTRFAVYVSDFAGERNDFAEQFQRVAETLLPIEEMRIDMHFVDGGAQIFRDYPYELFACACFDSEATTN